jgi:hypothetical protein
MEMGMGRTGMVGVGMAFLNHRSLFSRKNGMVGFDPCSQGNDGVLRWEELDTQGR